MTDATGRISWDDFKQKKKAADEVEQAAAIGNATSVRDYRAQLDKERAVRLAERAAMKAFEAAIAGNGVAPAAEKRSKKKEKKRKSKKRHKHTKRKHSSSKKKRRRRSSTSSSSGSDSSSSSSSSSSSDDDDNGKPKAPLMMKLSDLPPPKRSRWDTWD